MWSKENLSAGSPGKKIGWFLILWLVVNIVQALFMELHEDEAYYWLYSRFLDLGYFDHPPMIALFIKVGDLLFHNTLGVRLISILASTFSIYFLWKIVKQYAINASLFILLFLSFLLFHIYGFIATPDSPLFFFTVLFFYGYQRYLKEDKFKWTFYLAIVIAGLLYSKYHGILILLFTILSNFKIVKRSSFWMIVVLALLFYAPHIWWQMEHGFPSVVYQLSERSPQSYRFAFTLEFVLAQILIAAPLVGWYFFTAGFKARAEDIFLRSLKFCFYGIFIFFLVSTIKGRVEAHWTLTAFIPLLILTYIYLSRRNSIPKWLIRLAIANVILIVAARLIFILPPPFMQKTGVGKMYSGSRQWAKQVKEKAGENFVLFIDGFQETSKYNFYNRTTKGFSYNTRYKRRNQFDLWPLEDSLRGKKIYFVQRDPHFNTTFSILSISLGETVKQDSFLTPKKMYYGRWIENVRLYQKVEITSQKIAKGWKSNEVRTLELTIHNPYKDTISFSNINQDWKCYFEYAYLSKGKIIEVISLGNILEEIMIPSGQTKSITANIKAPSQPGEYKLIFSLRTEPFLGTRNSRIIDVNVGK